MVDVAIFNHPLSGLKVLQRHLMSVRALGIKPAKDKKFSCERTRVRKSRRADSDANTRRRELLRFV